MPKRPAGVCADRGHSHQNLERFAARVREYLKFSPTAAINTLRLFDGLDDITVQDGTGRVIPLRGNVIELKDSEGFTKYDSDRRIIEILASTETYDWLEQAYPRGGYFVAHELGHCLLHTNQLVRLAQMPPPQQAAFHRGGQVVEHKIYRDTEWQANAFASALLMPASGLLALEQECSEFCPSDIVKHFCVSIEAANYRFELYNKRKRQLV